MPERKKILFIVTQGLWGGAQRYVFDLALALRDEYEVTVAVGEPGGARDLQDRLRATAGGASPASLAPVRVVQLRRLRRDIMPWSDLLAIRELARLYRQLRPDIVHLNSTKTGIIGSLARALVRTNPPKIVYTVHGWIFNEPLGALRAAFYRALERATARYKDLLIVLAPQEARQGHEELGLPEGKIAVVPLGAAIPPARERSAARRELQERSIKKETLPLAGTWVGAIGTLYRTKGMDILLDALDDPGSPLRAHQFVIIGEGPERADLERRIRASGLAGIVHLLGRIDEASAYLTAFDVLAIPSRKEGLPYVLLEALQCGVPVVSARVGGIPSIIENRVSGLLIEPGNPRELHDALLYAIRNPDEAQRWANHAQSGAAGRTTEKMAQATKTIYSSLLTR